MYGLTKIPYGFDRAKESAQCACKKSSAKVSAQRQSFLCDKNSWAGYGQSLKWWTKTFSGSRGRGGARGKFDGAGEAVQKIWLHGHGRGGFRNVRDEAGAGYVLKNHLRDEARRVGESYGTGPAGHQNFMPRTSLTRNMIRRLHVNDIQEKCELMGRVFGWLSNQGVSDPVVMMDVEDIRCFADRDVSRWLDRRRRLKIFKFFSVVGGGGGGGWKIQKWRILSKIKKYLFISISECWSVQKL